jgi:transcription antitermination protein NusB
MLRQRSRAREVALQLLFQYDLNSVVPREDVVQFIHERLNEPTALEPFCLALYEGVLAHRPAIDHRLAEAAENWRLPRMPLVDRNVMRLGGYELLYTPDTPPRVALDEAIELARRFGATPDSPAFVNGVLDRLRLNAAAAAPANPPAVPLPPA